MPYLYILQPVEYINTNCYKIGLSSTFDLNRLKSYGVGTRYIQYFECSNYREAETELIHKLRREETVTLFKGREYFYGDKQTILNIFIQVMLKYTNMEREEKNIENITENNIKEVLVNKIINNKVNSTEVVKNQYTCSVCDYKTLLVQNYNKHLKTLRHKKNIESSNICNSCFKQFVNKYTRKRHEKNCKQIININNTQNISPELLETFVIHIQKLKDKKLSDCFQKVVLEQMLTEDADIMDYLEEFDKKILEESERIQFKDLSIDYKFQYDHEETEFKISEKSICDILSDILMSNAIKLVITHETTDLEGSFRILFKHKNSLHDDNILLKFINKSKYLNKLNISDDFKPIEILRKRYPDFYKSLEDKVKQFFNKYNRTMSK
jgi:hypothetical protein